MAKKKTRIYENPIPVKNGKKEMTDSMYEKLGDMRLMLMTTMAEMGISAEEYDSFLKSDIDREKIKKTMLDMSDYPFDDDFEEYEFEDEDEDSRSSLTLRPINDKVVPMADADKKSLRIKVQMKDVSKPPMWRELVIPADFNFSQLHYAIQAATGLMNCHLWQFQRRAYQPDLQIGIPVKDEYGYGLEEWTHDADKTPVTAFLAKKGDKLEYVYDFGDDWIFTVSVLEVMERDEDVAELKKWKCDMQPIEDCGGVYEYCRLRDIAENISKIDKQTKKEVVAFYGFDNFDMFAAWLDEANIDPEYISERLADIPDEFEDID